MQHTEHGVKKELSGHHVEAKHQPTLKEIDEQTELCSSLMYGGL